MKNCILTIAGMLLTTTLAFAQPLGNHLYFSGQLGFNSSSGSTSMGSITMDDPSSFSYTIAPAIGYTIADNFLVGIRPGFTGTRIESINGAGDEVINRSSMAGAAIFGRYYFPLSERFLFYPDLNIGYFSQSSETESAGVTVENPNTNIFVVGVVPGLAYYPTTHWAIELSAGFIGFTSSSSTDDSVDPNIESKSSDFQFSLDAMTVNVGVSYLLPL